LICKKKMYDYNCASILKFRADECEHFIKECSVCHHTRALVELKVGSGILACQNEPALIQKAWDIVLRHQNVKSNGVEQLPIGSKRSLTQIKEEEVVHVIIWFDAEDSTARQLGRVEPILKELEAVRIMGNCRSEDFICNKQNLWIDTIKKIKMGNCLMVDVPKGCSILENKQWVFHLQYVLNIFFLCPFQHVSKNFKNQTWVSFTSYVSSKYSDDSSKLDEQEQYDVLKKLLERKKMVCFSVLEEDFKPYNARKKKKSGKKPKLNTSSSSSSLSEKNYVEEYSDLPAEWKFGTQARINNTKQLRLFACNGKKIFQLTTKTKDYVKFCIDKSSQQRFTRLTKDERNFLYNLLFF